MKKKAIMCGVCCRTSINFETINDLTKEILEVLLLKITPNEEMEPVICKICVKMVRQLFDFKTKCLYVEDSILPFLKPKEDGYLDMKQIYLDVLKKDGKIVDVPDNEKICRLCMELVKNRKYISLRGSEEEAVIENVILQEYFPEMCLETVKDSVICTLCQKSLQKYYNFIMNIIVVKQDSQQMDIDLKIFQGEMINEQPEDDINTVNIPEKMLGNYEESNIEDYLNSFKGNKSKGKQPTIRERPHEKPLHECDMCLYKTHRRGNLKIHQDRKHQGAKSIAFKCDLCPYATYIREDFIHHNNSHKDGGQSFKCDKCPFTVAHKGQYKRHLLIHKNTKEVKRYKCDKCKYSTDRNDALSDHKEIHKRPSERKLHKCPICSATVTHKLKRHMLLHKDNTDELDLHKCPVCIYATMRSDSLKRHMLRHEKDSNATTHNCERCRYKTTDKSSLKVHMLKHKRLEEVATHQCRFCPYQTKYRSSLKSHIMTHRSKEEVETFKCYNCDYEAKTKGCLATHMLVHRDTDQVPMHKCKLCGFETKRLQILKRHVVSKHYEELCSVGADERSGT